MITIRLADKEKDFQSILTCAIKFAASSGLAEFLPKDASQFVSSLRSTISIPAVEVVLAEKDGVVVGGMGLVFAPFLWDHSKTICDELFFWVDPEAPVTTAMRLLKETSRMTNGRADIISFHCLTTSPPKVADVYIKMGMRPTQLTFMGHS